MLGLLHKKYLPLRGLPFSSYLHRQTRGHNLESVVHFSHFLCCPLSQRYTTTDPAFLRSLYYRHCREDVFKGSVTNLSIQDGPRYYSAAKWSVIHTIGIPSSNFYTLSVSYRTSCKFGLSFFFAIPIHIFIN